MRCPFDSTRNDRPCSPQSGEEGAMALSTRHNSFIYLPPNYYYHITLGNSVPNTPRQRASYRAGTFERLNRRKLLVQGNCGTCFIRQHFEQCALDRASQGEGDNDL